MSFGRGPDGREADGVFRKFSSGGTVYNQSCLASSAAVASLSRQTGKSLLASTSPVANLARQIAKSLQVTTQPVASLSKQTAKILQVTCSPIASCIADFIPPAVADLARLVMVQSIGRLMNRF